MSEPDPSKKDKDKKDKKDVIPPEEEKLIIKLQDSVVDPALQQSMELIVKQNKELLDSNKKMSKIIEDQDTKRARDEYDQQRTVLLEELETTRKGMAEKYKKEADLGLIKNAIKLAKEWNKEEDFDEIEGSKGDGKDEDILAAHWNPPDSKKATSKTFGYDKKE